MRFDYDKAAPTYDNHRRGGGPYLPILHRLAQQSGAGRVLEIGPGTGNNTSAFLEAFPCSLIGLERSRGMLARAAAKKIPARWLHSDAHAIPLADRSIDFIFGVLVLHHITDLDAVFSECARILRNGYAAFITSPHDFIERHPMNRYFPSFKAVDMARFQPVEELRASFRSAGFAETGIERTTAAPTPIDQAYLAKIENKFISTYDLIPPNEYQEGLARMRAEIEANGRLDADMCWECATVWARRA